MAQTKRKTSTRTAKKTTSASRTHKRVASRTCCKKGSYKSVSGRERMHLFIVTALSIIAGILLCTDAVIINMA
ncbi:MAG: hypothetical protein Q4B87_01950 [Candidatus Saccharibacteria bacterium]|nr:hypothetical protein [Candidatus Saccharibacteria bacterium]